MAEVLVAAVRLNFCDVRPSPPTKNDRPSTSSRLPTMLPVIEALTSATWPLPERDDGDDQLGRVAERRVQEPADRRSRAVRERPPCRAR